MRVHFLIHEAFEAPGAYLTWAKENGHTVSMTEVYQGDNLPKNDEDLDMLIVMGGPQSPTTTKEECPYFDAAAEIGLMQDFIAVNKPVVGVCLGAQLLGEACGAPVEKSPYKEIGNFPIELTTEGSADDKLKSFGLGLVVGHWHGDMPGLPSGAQVLAASEGCPRQIIKFGDKQYGFQCHLEFSRDLVAGLIAQEADLEGEAKQEPFVQNADELLHYDYDVMNAALADFLTKLVVNG